MDSRFHGNDNKGDRGKDTKGVWKTVEKIIAGFLRSLRSLRMTIGVLLLMSPSAHTDVNSNLTHFFNSLGGAANVTRPGAYQDQRGGFYTGGRFFARNTVQQANLLSIQIPDYRAGCGGIDGILGSLSFLGTDKLVEMLRAVGSNMASYGLLLAIETVSPQIKNIITELSDWAQRFNQMNMNSCAIAATALGSLLPRSEKAKEHLCTMIGTDRKYSLFSDYAAARQGCGAEGKRDDVLASSQNDPRYEKILGTEFNVAWKALQENGFLSSDTHLAQFFLSLSGTIISRTTNGVQEVIYKPALVDKDEMLTALLYGGKTQTYACQDKDKCLRLTKQSVTISEQAALVHRVRLLLEGIQAKIRSDKPLENHEIGFLNATQLPFYKILNVLTAYKRGEAPLDISDYAALGAIDLLFHYLREVLDFINESVTHLQQVQVDPTHIREFQKSLHQSRQRVIQRRSASYKEMEKHLSVLKKTQMIERMLLLKAGMLMRGDT